LKVSYEDPHAYLNIFENAMRVVKHLFYFSSHWAPVHPRGYFLKLPHHQISGPEGCFVDQSLTLIQVLKIESTSKKPWPWRSETQVMLIFEATGSCIWLNKRWAFHPILERDGGAKWFWGLSDTGAFQKPECYCRHFVRVNDHNHGFAGFLGA